MSLPAADDLFRPTVVPSEPQVGDASSAGDTSDHHSEEAAGSAGRGTGRTPSGRVRHDEKMTVYVTAEELLDLEHARLTLRRRTGQAVDRGRLVRAAVAIALADLEDNGDESQIVQRLMQP